MRENLLRNLSKVVLPYRSFYGHKEELDKESIERSHRLHLMWKLINYGDGSGFIVRENLLRNLSKVVLP